MVKYYMTQFADNSLLRFPEELWSRFRQGFVSTTISDEETLATIATVYAQDEYLLDPHGAVAVAAAWNCRDSWEQDDKVLCLATAHPAKFPEVIDRVFNKIPGLDLTFSHPSIEAARNRFHHLRTCSYDMLEPALIQAIRNKL
jgi:threonine synthase